MKNSLLSCLFGLLLATPVAAQTAPAIPSAEEQIAATVLAAPCCNSRLLLVSLTECSILRMLLLFRTQTT